MDQYNQKVDRSLRKVQVHLDSKGDTIMNYSVVEATSVAEFILLILANSANQFKIGSGRDWGKRTMDEILDHERRVEALRQQREFADILNTWDTTYDGISYGNLLWLVNYGLFINGDLKRNLRKRETIFERTFFKEVVEKELRAAILEELVKEEPQKLVDALVEELAASSRHHFEYQEEISKLLRKTSDRMHNVKKEKDDRS